MQGETPFGFETFRKTSKLFPKVETDAIELVSPLPPSGVLVSGTVLESFVNSCKGGPLKRSFVVSVIILHDLLFISVME